MRQALRRFGRHPLTSLFEVAVLGIAIALPLGLHLAVDNLRAFAVRFPAEPEISIFMQVGADRSASNAVEKRLRQMPDVDRVTFVPRAEALAALRKSAGLAEVLDALPANPLPDALTVRLKIRDTRRLESLQKEASTWPQVALVQVDSSWSRKLEAAIGVGQVTALLLAAVLGVAVVAITFNTVRLQMANRRDEIELSRLIGATNGFIRRPYLYFGVLQGLFGGGIAIGLVTAAGIVLNNALTTLAEAYGAQVRLEAIPPEIGLVVLVGAAGLGCCAAWLSAGRRLWRSSAALVD